MEKHIDLPLFQSKLFNDQFNDRFLGGFWGFLLIEFDPFLDVRIFIDQRLKNKVQFLDVVFFHTRCFILS